MPYQTLKGLWGLCVYTAPALSSNSKPCLHEVNSAVLVVSGDQ